MSVNNLMWTEKHRPKTMDDVVGHDDIVDNMRGWVDDPSMPHILFSGPQGSGKTALTTAFARERYGEGWRKNVLEMNASDSRGIDVVRDQIKGFAREGTAGDADDKLIFLDEADSLTKDAQAALRRVMEDFSEISKFVMSCNYQNKIINPIQSRCVVFRMAALTDDQIGEVVSRVLDEEGVSTDRGVISKVVKASKGDARRAVHTLQVASNNGHIQESDVDGIIGGINDDEIKGILQDAMDGEYDRAMDAVQQDFLRQGVPSEELADSFYRTIKDMDIAEDSRMKMMHKLADKDYRISQGANPEIQWSAFLADCEIARYLSLDAYSPGGDEDV